MGNIWFIFFILMQYAGSKLVRQSMSRRAAWHIVVVDVSVGDNVAVANHGTCASNSRAADPQYGRDSSLTGAARPPAIPMHPFPARWPTDTWQ